MAKQPMLYPEGVDLPQQKNPTTTQVARWIKENKLRLRQVEARLAMKRQAQV